MVKVMKKNVSFIFILFVALLSSCSVDWFSNYKDIVEEELSVNYIFYSRNPYEMSVEPIFMTLKNYKVGQTLTKASLPDSGDPEIAKMNPGYEVAGWKLASSGVSSNILFDDEGHVSLVSVAKSDSAFYAEWKISDHTLYVVRHYRQNVDDDDYALFESEKMYGTTFQQTAAEAKDYTGFVPLTFDQTEILSDGSAVVNIYYDRKIVKVSLDITPGIFTENDTSTIELEGKYGAKLEVPEYTYAGSSIEKWGPDPLPASFPAEDSAYNAVWIRDTGNSGFEVTLPDNKDSEIKLSVSKLENKKFKVSASSLVVNLENVQVTAVLDGDLAYSGTDLSFEVDYGSISYGEHEFVVIIESSGKFYSAAAYIKLNYEEI